MFNLKKLIRVDNIVPAYCQICGEERTERGVLATEDGAVYCSGITWCLEKLAILKRTRIPFTVDFLSPKQLQLEIRKGTLRAYGPLK
jgi:hypothetical protein